MATILTKNIKILSWISLFTDLASEMLYPVMPVFLLSIGYTAPGIGLLEGFAEATAGIGKGFFGALSDHQKKRIPFVRIGYTLSALAKPMIGVFPSLAGVFICRTADRLGKGIRTGARDAVLADESTPENRARVFGFHRAMDTTGAVAGPLIAIAFLQFFPGDYSLLFLLAFIPGFFAILFTYLIRQKSVAAMPDKEFKPFAFLGYYQKASQNYRKIILILLSFALLNSSDMFLLMQLKTFGASDTLSILVYVLYNAVYAFFAFPLGNLAAKFGMKNMMVCGLIIFAIAYMGIGFSVWLPLTVFFFALYGLFTAATDGVSKALISTLCKKDDMATAMGFFNGAQSIMSLAAGALTGILWWKFGSAFALCFSGAGALLVAAFLAFSKMQKEI